MTGFPRLRQISILVLALSAAASGSPACSKVPPQQPKRPSAMVAPSAVSRAFVLDIHWGRRFSAVQPPNMAQVTPSRGRPASALSRMRGSTFAGWAIALAESCRQASFSGSRLWGHKGARCFAAGQRARRPLIQSFQNFWRHPGFSARALLSASGTERCRGQTAKQRPQLAQKLERSSVLCQFSVVFFLPASARSSCFALGLTSSLRMRL